MSQIKQWESLFALGVPKCKYHQYKCTSNVLKSIILICSVFPLDNK